MPSKTAPQKGLNMTTKTKMSRKPGPKSARGKKPAARKRVASAPSRARGGAAKRATPAGRVKAPARPAAAKGKPAARPIKAATKPKTAAKPAKAPVRKPAARPQPEPKTPAKLERPVKAPAPAKVGAKASAPRLAPAAAPVGQSGQRPAQAGGAPVSAPAAPKPAPRDGRILADGPATTAAAALKARVPAPENVRKLPERPVVPALERESFSEGDFVVYPTHGVGRVVAIETQQIAGISLPLIVITFDKDRMTLRVPVAKAHNSGLRKLSSRKVMDTALATLKGRSRVKRTMWSRRAQEYEAKINSGDPVSIAEVVRDLHRGSDQPDQSYSERQIYQAALDRLARELAAVERIDEQAAAQRLEEMLKAA